MRFVLTSLLVLVVQSHVLAHELSTVPKDLTADQFAWLCELGKALPASREALLSLRKQWTSTGFANRAGKALRTPIPLQADAWVPAIKGLVALTESLGDPRLRRTSTLFQLVAAEVLVRRFDEAASTARQARTACDQQGDLPGIAEAIRWEGFALQGLNRYNDSLALLSDARARFALLHDKFGEATCCTDIALVQNEQGHPQDALRSITDAESLYQASGKHDAAFEARFLLVGGGVHEDSGDPAQAIAMFEASAAKHEAIGDRHGWAISRLCLANRLVVEGKAADAAALFDQASNAFSETGDRSGAASCLLGLGNLYYNISRYQVAVDLYRRAALMASDLHDQRQLAAAKGNMASATHDWADSIQRTSLVAAKPRFAEAERTYEEALRIQKNIGDDSGLVKSLSGLSRLLWHSNLGPDPDPKVALRILSLSAQAVSLAESTGKIEDLAAACSACGALYLDMTMPDLLPAYVGWTAPTSEKYLLRAADAYQTLGDVENEAIVRGNLAELYRLLRRKEDALREASRALDLVEQARARTPDAQSAASIAARSGGIDARAAAIALDLGRPDLAFELCERARGAVVRQAMLAAGSAVYHLSPGDRDELARRTRAVEDADRRKCASPGSKARADAWANARTELAACDLRLQSKYSRIAKPVSSVSLTDVGAALGPDAAAVEILAADDELIFLVVTCPGGIATLKHVRIPVRQLAASTKAEAYARGLRDATSAALGDDLRKMGKELHSWLIEPWKRLLAPNVRRLVLCPDDSLLHLPLLALIDSEGRFLVEDYAVTTAPSIAAWLTCRRVSDANRGGRPLLVGVSTFGDRAAVRSGLVHNTRGPERLPDLQLAVTEVDRIARQFHGDATKLVDAAATVQAVKQALSGASVLHFATHARADLEQPLMSSLVLWSTGPDDPGMLYARDIASVPLRARLAVLSACGTNSGMDTGEGPLGLSWSFLAAGCPATVATRWDIVDASAEQWVRTFYRCYQGKRMSKADSFRQACLLTKNTPGFSAPRYWANWVLTGDDR